MLDAFSLLHQTVQFRGRITGIEIKQLSSLTHFNSAILVFEVVSGTVTSEVVSGVLIKAF